LDAAAVAAELLRWLLKSIVGVQKYLRAVSYLVVGKEAAAAVAASAAPCGRRGRWGFEAPAYAAAQCFGQTVAAVAAEAGAGLFLVQTCVAAAGLLQDFET